MGLESGTALDVPVARASYTISGPFNNNNGQLLPRSRELLNNRLPSYLLSVVVRARANQHAIRVFVREYASLRYNRAAMPPTTQQEHHPEI